MLQSNLVGSSTVSSYMAPQFVLRSVLVQTGSRKPTCCSNIYSELFRPGGCYWKFIVFGVCSVGFSLGDLMSSPECFGCFDQTVCWWCGTSLVFLLWEFAAWQVSLRLSKMSYLFICMRFKSAISLEIWVNVPVCLDCKTTWLGLGKDGDCC